MVLDSLGTQIETVTDSPRTLQLTVSQVREKIRLLLACLGSSQGCAESCAHLDVAEAGS